MNQPTQPSPKPSANDERPLLTVEQAMENADFDDKLWLWWKKNARSLGVSAVVFIAVVTAFQVAKIVREESKKGVQNAFSRIELKDAQALEKFGKANPAHLLGGVSLLTAADLSLEAGQLDKAFEQYREAGKALESSILKPRALMGQAIIHYRKGKSDDALIILEAVAQDPSLSTGYRAQSAFMAGMIRSEKNEFIKADEWFSKAEAMDKSGIYANQVEMVRSTVEELSPEAVVAARKALEPQTEETPAVENLIVAPTESVAPAENTAVPADPLPPLNTAAPALSAPSEAVTAP